MQTYLHERIDEVLTNGTTEDVAVYIYGSRHRHAGVALASKLARQMGSSSRASSTCSRPRWSSSRRPTSRSTCAAAQKYGLTPGDVRRFAAVEMASEPVSTVTWDGQVINVAAWTTPATRNSLADLESLQVDTPSGGHVPLGKLATITIAAHPEPDHPGQQPPDDRGRRERGARL